MTNITILIFLMLTSMLPEKWESSIDRFNGLSYLKVAEDLAALGIHSSPEHSLVQQLFVLSAVVDPHLRESAILGLISISRDSDFAHKLLAMRSRSNQLLVPSIVQQQQTMRANVPDSIDQVCLTLSDIRQGKIIDKEQAEQLQPWAYMFPGGFTKFTMRTSTQSRMLSSKEIESTLKVELAVLGGATMWSADYAATAGRPVALSANDDLAVLLNVDPTKRIRKNGQWVAR